MNFTFVPSEPFGPSLPLSDDNNQKRDLKWSQYTPETASRNKQAPLKQRTIASDIPLDQLNVSPQQLKQLKEMHRGHATTDDGVLPVDHLYTLSDDDQLAASAIMAQQGLDVDAREGIDNRWSQQWSRLSTNSVKATNKTRRILYLCRCGYDHTQSHTKERHTPVPFTSCLAHAEITIADDSHKILRIRGYFHHNDACKQAEYTRIPPVPVHPSVFVVALSQLRDGATFADVKKKNRELFVAGGYKDFPVDLSTTSHRWLPETRDSRSLYRQFQRMNGGTRPPAYWSDWSESNDDVLKAARRGLVPRVTRRLVDAERRLTASGSVLVFDEDAGGIKMSGVRKSREFERLEEGGRTAHGTSREDWQAAPFTDISTLRVLSSLRLPLWLSASCNPLPWAAALINTSRSTSIQRIILDLRVYGFDLAVLALPWAALDAELVSPLGTRSIVLTCFASTQRSTGDWLKGELPGLLPRAHACKAFQSYFSPTHFFYWPGPLSWGSSLGVEEQD
ncbi:hypothetical protein FB451DRAFT_1395192 [Mycena latifolia]|nr:hypothetical protein FB451DRAFT_1395192 [Mycena latifolia]